MGELGERRAAAVVWAVLIAAAVTSALVVWGPQPVPSPALYDPADGLLEVRERWWWLGWAVVPPLATWALWRLPATWWHRLPWVGLGGVLLGGAALVVLATEPTCELERWNGPGLWAIGFGLACAWGLLGRGAPAGRARLVLTALGAAGWARVALYLHQTPTTLIDPFHFTFLADNLLLWAAGGLPLVEAVPTYTVLLGVPLAWLLSVSGAEPLAATCAYVWGLTLLTMGLVVGALWRLLGTRWLWLALLLVAAVPMVADRCAGGCGAPLGSYPLVWPVRLLVPAATLALLAAWRTRPTAHAGWPLALGGLAALGVGCNLDFGLVNLVAAGGCLGLLAWRDGRPGWGVAFGAGVAGVAGGLAAAYRAAYGLWPDLSGPWQYLQLFNAVGFFNVDMPAVGLNTVAAAFVTLSLWLAAASLADGDRDPRLEVLAYAAAFALGTLAYYAGRSLPVVLLGGSGLHLAVCAVLWAVMRVERPSWPCAPADGLGRAAVAAGGLLPLAVLLAALTQQPLAWRAPVPDPGWLQAPAPPPLPAGTATFAGGGSVWRLRWGVPSALALGHPAHLVGPAWADACCEGLARGGRRALYVEPGVVVWKHLRRAASRPACQRLGLTPQALDAIPRERRLREWVLVPLPGASGP
ncbi:MAG: hypothetical protein VKS61_13285 [Candidatus Sericytochromatia bacterium]|nr:hypothetical protein [Candidatus Sericytochromatia bacterium]